MPCGNCCRCVEDSLGSPSRSRRNGRRRCGTRRCDWLPAGGSFPHDLLDLFDAVSAATAVEAIAVDRCRGRSSCLTALAPDHAPVEHLIDVAELADRWIECVAGDRQRLVGAPEQLGRNLFAVDLQREFTIQSGSPSAMPQMRQPSPLGVTSDRYCGRYRGNSAPRRRSNAVTSAAAMIEIDRRERIVLGQDVADAVSVPGLHSRQRGGVIRPCAGILRAGMAIRLRRHERRLLPTAFGLLCPSPHRPLRPLDQRRQRPRQFCQIA